METEITKCNSCGQPMIEIGKIRQSFDAISFLQPEQKLYQCSECKEVKLY